MHSESTFFVSIKIDHKKKFTVFNAKKNTFKSIPNRLENGRRKAVRVQATF